MYAMLKESAVTLPILTTLGITIVGSERLASTKMQQSWATVSRRLYTIGCSVSKRFSNLIDFQGTLLGDPVTATLTTNYDNEDGDITSQNNFLS